jgi:hypothetical protein
LAGAREHSQEEAGGRSQEARRKQEGYGGHAPEACGKQEASGGHSPEVRGKHLQEARAQMAFMTLHITDAKNRWRRCLKRKLGEQVLERNLVTFNQSGDVYSAYASRCCTNEGGERLTE